MVKLPDKCLQRYTILGTSKSMFNHDQKDFLYQPYQFSEIERFLEREKILYSPYSFYSILFYLLYKGY